MTIAAGADVRSAIAGLRTEWIETAAKTIAGGPDSANLDRLDADLGEFGFACAEAAVNDDPARPRVFRVLMPPHVRAGIHVPGGRFGYDNPDTVYRTIPVDGVSSYVITGAVNPVAPTDINVSLDSALFAGTITTLARRDLVTDRDGHFTITVDPFPAHGRANHIRTTSAAKQIFIRDTIGDWNRQTPTTLTVARTAGPPPAAVETDRQLTHDAVVLIKEYGSGPFHLITQQLAGRTPANVVVAPPALGAVAGALSTQRQTIANFDLSDTAALVTTISTGGAAYFTFPVTDDWAVTPDYWSRTSSLNSAQAQPNSDGTYTFVLSEHDPGVRNWIDPDGLRQGTLFLRWQGFPASGAGPGPTVTEQVVPIADLPRIPAAGTQPVGPAERGREQALRLAGFERLAAS